MSITAVIFPFDLFGSGGTSSGATLIADELRNILADNQQERVATRAQSYTNNLRIREFQFETLAAYQNWRKDGRQAVRQAWRKSDCLLWITGNHLGVLPIYEELGRRGDTCIVQLDAHLDIHHFADCTEELSHGNFLRHCQEKLPPIVNVGHRELLLPSDYIQQYYQDVISAEQLAVAPAQAIAHLQQATQNTDYLLIDIDCDVLDPFFFPAVTQPMPFGLSPQQLLSVIAAVWSEKIIGLTLSEFDPGRDQRDQSLSTLLWLLEYFLIRKSENI